jgi:hypothetical protein
LVGKRFCWTKNEGFLIRRPHKKSVKKILCRALRNEIDVTNAWNYFYPVSSTNAGVYSKAVTYFILDLHTIFSFFYAVLNFWFFCFKTKEQQNTSFQLDKARVTKDKSQKVFQLQAVLAGQLTQTL